VKEVWVDSHRYILCLNVKQARKEAFVGDGRSGRKTIGGVSVQT